jgi:hypothetical protein
LLWFGLKFAFKPETVESNFSRQEHFRTLLASKFYYSTNGAALFICIFSTPYIVLILSVVLAVPEFAGMCKGCAPENIVTVCSLAVIALTLVVGNMVFLYRSWHLPDFWGLHKTARTGTVLCSLAFFFGLFILIDTEWKYYFLLVPMLFFAWFIYLNSITILREAFRTEFLRYVCFIRYSKPITDYTSRLNTVLKPRTKPLIFKGWLPRTRWSSW